MKKKISNLLITIFLTLSLSGCSYLFNNSGQPDIPHKPILESSHKVRKDITYRYENNNGKIKSYTLKKNGLYLNQEDTKELLHYINNMQNELEDLQ